MKFLQVITLLFFSLTSVGKAEVQVVDGDTLKLNETTYRLHGIDAPEYGQKCNKLNGKTWPCGKQATEVLGDLILGKRIACEPKENDGYGRVIAVCYADGENLNAYMIQNGLAWAFRKYSNDYVTEEDSARVRKIGIWQSYTTTAWDYRKARWNSAEQLAPEGCPIKGNISRNGTIYHVPWSPWYRRTKINEAKGERWFCDEGEAVAAGWRAPRWGK